MNLPGKYLVIRGLHMKNSALDLLIMSVFFYLFFFFFEKEMED